MQFDRSDGEWESMQFDNGDESPPLTSSSRTPQPPQPLIITDENQASQPTSSSTKRSAPADGQSNTKRKKTAMADPDAINSITSTSGTGISIAKKPQKQRSDIGVKRGPQQKNTPRA